MPDSSPQKSPLKRIEAPDDTCCEWCANLIEKGDAVFARDYVDGVFCSQRCIRLHQQDWEKTMERLISPTRHEPEVIENTDPQHAAKA